MKQIDLIARQSYYLDHLAPIWNGLPDDIRGNLYLLNDPGSRKLVHREKIKMYEEGGDCGHNPILAASYGDAVRAADYDPSRPVILMEHGVGLTFGKASYADGVGQRGKISLFLMPSDVVAGKIHPELINKPHPVIGVPKMDPWAGKFVVPQSIRNPTVAISFHHGDKNSRPGVVGSAWEYYEKVLPKLKEKYRLIAHGHAMAHRDLQAIYSRLGIETVGSFQEVMERADIYINDASSTAYEFLLTGKPVILMNAPWFDRSKNYGIRFWEYADIGLSVECPDELIDAIEKTVQNTSIRLAERQRAVRDLFPHLGRSTQKAIEEICKHVGIKTNYLVGIDRGSSAGDKSVKTALALTDNMPKIHKKPRKKIEDCGVLYMCFGPSAMCEMTKSIDSLRNAGCSLPIAVVGDQDTFDTSGTLKNQVSHWIVWDGKSPYDASQRSMLHFLAGRVKPDFYRLSPFTHTLYVDVDVKFIQNPQVGFGFLERWDFVIAHERLTVHQLYNRPRAGWEHNMLEKQYTIDEIGGDGNFHFWNSGLFFFKKSKAAQGLFALWKKEWNIWKQWDEQLALMRAANRSRARVFVLAEIWNHPHDSKTTIEVPPASFILHLYGRGAARSDTPITKGGA